MKIRYTILSVLSLAAVGAAAQDLKKEITVDRTVQPDLREIPRPGGVAPAIVAPAVTGNKLSAAEYTRVSKIDNEAADLPAAPWHDSIPVTPYRGYASVGYLPAVNFGANAGYRYSTDRGHVGAWMQYDLANWRGRSILPDVDGKEKAGISSLALGADAMYRLSGRSVVGADIAYTHTSVGTPWISPIGGEQKRYGQRADKFNARGAWRGAVQDFSVHAALGFEHFRFGSDIPTMLMDPIESSYQNIVSADLGIGLTDGSDLSPWAGIDLDWDFVKSTGMEMLTPDANDKAGYTLGHLRPYMLFGDEESVYGRLGLNLSVSTGNSNGHVRLAPDVQVGWTATPDITIYGIATGGEYINKESALFAGNRYMADYYAYERSNLALEVEGGVKVVPMTGFRFNLYAGYAIGRNRLTPYLSTLALTYGNHESWFVGSNINSWRAGLSASYMYKELFGLRASVEVAGSNKDYATWQYRMDGAKLVSEIALTVHPTEKLDVDVSYDLRTDRKVAGYMYVPMPARSAYDTWLEYHDIIGLGNLASLNLHAAYRYTDRITFFAGIENMLNKRCWLVGGVPDQGIHGLMGVACKF